MAIRGIVFHWTAGRYNQTFNDYHYNITYDPAKGKAKVVKTCTYDTDKKSHTWSRNSDRIGITLCCAYNATPSNLGNYPPTDAQIETTCALAGKLAHTYGIRENEIKTHAEWAFIDDYGLGSGDTETRWDLWIPDWKHYKKNLSSVMRDKTLFYKDQFEGHVDDPGVIYEPKTVELSTGKTVYLPSIFKVVKEAHLVTKDDPHFSGSWPNNSRDKIEEHYALSERATGYKMKRTQSWCPSGEGNCKFGKGSNGKPPADAESWYMCMYWKNPPEPGTRMIMKNPVNGKMVVAAAGYEVGPSRPKDCLGGACEEIHHYLGTTRGSKLEVGFAKDQTLDFGPLE